MTEYRALRVKVNAFLSGRAMDVYTRISNKDANDYNELNKALLTRYNFTEDGYKRRFRDINPETEEMPDQFVNQLKKLPSNAVQPSGSILGTSKLK